MDEALEPLFRSNITEAAVLDLVPGKIREKLLVIARGRYPRNAIVNKQRQVIKFVSVWVIKQITLTDTRAAGHLKKTLPGGGFFGSISRNIIYGLHGAGGDGVKSISPAFSDNRAYVKLLVSVKKPKIIEFAAKQDNVVMGATRFLAVLTAGEELDAVLAKLGTEALDKSGDVLSVHLTRAKSIVEGKRDEPVIRRIIGFH